MLRFPRISDRVNYYETLKVSPDATNAEIKSAYRRLARKLHPDKNNGSEQTALAFAAIAEAYEVLSNSRERMRYDQQLLEMSYDARLMSDSILASSNAHAKRWRQMVYEHRYNEIIDRMIAEERRESMALQKTIFPVVALLLSTLVAAMLKPQFFMQTSVIGKIVIISLFAAGAIHLVGRIRDGLERFTFNDQELHDSILDGNEPAPRHYSRAFMGGALVLAIFASFGIGFLIGQHVTFVSVWMPQMFASTLQPEFVLYPPIFVLFVGLVHKFALLADG